MKGFLRLVLILVCALALVRCASLSDGDSGLDDSAAVEGDFDGGEADFDGGEADSSAFAKEGESESGGDELSLEDELNQAEGDSSVAQEENSDSGVADSPEENQDEFAEFQEPEKTDQVAQQQDEQVAQQKTDEFNEFDQAMDATSQLEQPPLQPQVDLAEEPPPPVIAEPISSPAPVVPQQAANIKNIKYKANDAGGAVVIEGDAPLTYNVRSNPETHQFVIEISNANLPAKLKRPFNTRDMKGGIGSVDAYQNKGSSVARIVVQLRPGVTEPTVQAEGNSLLVVQSGTSVAHSSSGDALASDQGHSTGSEGDGNFQTRILSTGSLDEFLSGNTQFYGKKISLEVSKMDIREVFKLIAEESGVNLVLSDDVKGTVSLKLRQVPWDQALVVIMKAQKLGYTRAGSILRVAPIADIKAEESDSQKMIAARNASVPLKVQMIPISYAKIDDLVAQIKPFLSEPRGKVIGDNRTSAVVVTDLDENLERISKLIASIDVPPAQVLIEGKIVEASEEFQKRVGVNWTASGKQGLLGYAAGGRQILTQTGIQISPSLGSAAAQLNFQLGTLDVLGDLNATLALFERQSAVKVLSSPRIVTLHNEAAEITQATEVPLIKETVTATGTTRSVDFKSVKLKLQVTPQITNDSSIIMAVDVNRDFLTGVVDQATQANPVATRSAKTRVMVRNSQTAVIGGIYQSDLSNVDNKVPWVGEIPIFGWLFKSRAQQNNKNELLIFLTPRILSQNEGKPASSQNSEGALQ
jgi:type IV pilus assembly protein PilQ